MKKKKKALDSMNVARILHSKEIFASHPDFVEQDGILIVIYTFTQSTITMH